MWVSADLSLLQPKDKGDPEAGATKCGAVPTIVPYLTPAIQNLSYKDDHSLILNFYPLFSYYPLSNIKTHKTGVLWKPQALQDGISPLPSLTIKTVNPFSSLQE